MKNLFPLVSVTLIILLSGCSQDGTWSMQEGPLKSRWASEVTPNNAWNEYPRPHMVRHNWKNLNGLWDYTITSKETGFPDTTHGQILVPYPVESALSGVMKRLTPDEKIWYSRKLSIPAKLKSQRVLLHFEAVDWEMTAWIDGKEIGSHRGGYDPFTFDVTEYIKPGQSQQLLVSVWDPSTDGMAPVGKQTNNPHGIWYTPSSGIWQTVWMETVPDSYIESYFVNTDIDLKQATIRVTAVDPRNSDRIEVDLVASGKLVGTYKGELDEPLLISLDEMRLWQPSDPFLYDLKIRLMRGKNKVDAVDGYFGMRKISVGKDEQGITRILLNNQFVFQNGPLDQGFWPDGLNTPPSDEAMVYDLDMTLAMGFNMLRKHVKVEPRRFYYHTDRLGLLVWQDMPSMFYGVFKEGQSEEELAAIRQNFEAELRELILDHYNHPSIIMWVPFNEGWGQYETERIVEYVYSLDRSRLVNNASGWTDKGVGDVLDIHNYPEPRAPKMEENRAIVLGEFGGLGLYVPGHVWQEENWGYEKLDRVEDLLSRYEDFYQEVFRLRDEAGLSAVVYTQTTDVETETNGLMTYDRDSVKMGIANIARAHAGKVPPRLTSGIRQFIERMDLELADPSGSGEIRFTTDGTEPVEESMLYTAPIGITAGTLLKARTFWPGGESSRTATFDLQQVVPRAAVEAGGSPGLKVSFYEGDWSKLPDFGQITPVRTGVAKQVNLDFARSTQYFGLVFEGYLKAPATGVYSIYLSSDDGGRIYLGDDVLIDYDGIHGAGERWAPVALEKGVHPFSLIYFQRAGGLGLKVSWEGPGLPKQEIGTGYWGR